MNSSSSGLRLELIIVDDKYRIRVFYLTFRVVIADKYRFMTFLLSAHVTR
jgi:hypothetical protein